MLADAVAKNVITTEQAELIARTRLEDLELHDAARELRISYAAAKRGAGLYRCHCRLTARLQTTSRSTSRRDRRCCSRLPRGRVPTYTEGQDPLIYLVTTVEAVTAAGLRSVFSDGNCAAAITQVYADLNRLDSVIDWPLMQATMWNNTANDPDRKRHRQAEFLVHERVPVSCLAGIVVRTQPMREHVGRIVAAHGSALPVRVQPSWYF